MYRHSDDQRQVRAAAHHEPRSTGNRCSVSGRSAVGIPPTRSRKVVRFGGLCRCGALLGAMTASPAAHGEVQDAADPRATAQGMVHTSRQPWQVASLSPGALGYVSAQGPYVPGERTPRGFVLESHRRWDLVALGASFFAVGYGAPLAVAAGLEFSHDSKVLVAPVLGPLVLYGRFLVDAWDDCCTLRLVGPMAMTSALIGATALQAGGLVLVGVGLFREEHRWVRAPEPLSFEPWVGPGVQGARLTLTF